MGQEGMPEAGRNRATMTDFEAEKVVRHGTWAE